MSWLEKERNSLGASTHKTSPLVLLDGVYIGGRDDTISWCQKFVSVDDNKSVSEPIINTDVWNPEHGFDYDLVVIGGGSGGLACSKEANSLGAKVAVLDFVKPSPAGSKWGLGGTCVNVGCIPKKLMHTAALMNEHAHDAIGYGWEGGTMPQHNWSSLKDHVQDHIKGLNFGYRVQLREAGITYLNKMGKFTGPNELECTDNKGKVTKVTAARFVVAVGGRPTALNIPGGEYAISSDDLFMKATPPGKTCVIGAGYVALECAGFISGLHQGEVSVLVRSMPLRGFDRDLVDTVTTYMTAHGTTIIEGVTPASIVKLESGKFIVTYSNDESDEYDTVLCAVGRSADTDLLGLETLNLDINQNNKKIICNNEQTSTNNVYAVGDVVQGSPELTPVAILAGKLLARRLFGNSTQLMNYKDIATTIFTPLEFGTVGLNEDEANAVYGEENVDCYVSTFQPLEWSIANKKEGIQCFAKVVVDTTQNNKVLGLHIAAPNAGEIIQGFAVAFKKGLTHQDLIDTVGIHPTIAEEFTTMDITKSSGKSIAKSGC
jgi:thioredoxin reductase (NADPH)